MRAGLTLISTPAASGLSGAMLCALPKAPAASSAGGHAMPVGIIDYGVPIVDASIGTDRYMTLPSVRRNYIFDPGETRAFAEPPVGVAGMFEDPAASWLPERMSFTSRTFEGGEYERRLLDADRIAEMVRYLKDELGHPMEMRIKSPLIASKEATLLAVRKYIEIFGFFPSIPDLERQGLKTLYFGMRTHGGVKQIRSEIGAERPFVTRGSKSAVRSPSAASGSPKRARSKIGEMKSFLSSLGCAVDGKGPTPLLDNEELTSFAFGGYVALFGPVRSAREIDRQGFPALAAAVRKHGGVASIHRRLGIAGVHGLRAGRIVSRSGGTAPERASVGGRTASLSSGDVVRRGENFIAIDNGFHPPADVQLVMRFMNSHVDDRMKRESNGIGVDNYVALANGRLWIPVRADKQKRRLFFRKKDIPALIFVAKAELGSDEVFQAAIDELGRLTPAMNDKSPQWLQRLVWAAREFSIDSDRLETHLRAVLSQRHVKYFLSKTWRRYGEVEAGAIRTQNSSTLNFDV